MRNDTRRRTPAARAQVGRRVWHNWDSDPVWAAFTDAVATQADGLRYYDRCLMGVL